MTIEQQFTLCAPECSEDFSLSAAECTDFCPGLNWSVRKTTLKSGMSTGVDLIAVDQGEQTVYMIPTRGMGLWKIQRGEIRVGWDAPAPYPVHPMFVNLQARNGLGWLDGFNELLCRCGLAFNGPPGTDEDAPSPLESEITLHGLIANRPAERVELELVSEGEERWIVVRGFVREATLFGPHLELEAEYRLRIGSSEVQLTDRVHNRSSRPAEMQLLYHINVGTPLLEKGGQWLAPVKNVSPRDPQAAVGMETRHIYDAPTQGYAEQVFLCELHADAAHQTAAMMHNADHSLGFGLEFDQATLPCFSVWKNTQPLEEGYCTGLEPATNFPNFKSIERQQGRVVVIPAGQSWKTHLTLSILGTPEAVQAYAAKVKALHPPEA